MAEQNLIERLDQGVEAILTGRVLDVTGEPELAVLLAIAADLRDVPSPRFQTRLKEELMPVQTETEIKPGFHSITLYLVVDGAAELIGFLREAFGGQERLRVPRPDGTLMHAEVTVGDSVIEIGDTSEQFAARPGAIHLYVDDADAVYASAVRAGGTSMYAPMDQPYGDREAGVKDRWGNHWYIATRQGPSAKPEGFRTITPFLHPRGADQLMAFLTAAFGAALVEEPTRDADRRVLHAAMRIGDSILEMGEAHGEWKPIPCGIHLYVRDADEVYERALVAGATSVQPPGDRPYGERNATVEDPTGHLWFIATPT